VALDDVGAAPASLAVPPFVRPDLIKLDMRLLQGRTTAEAAHIVNTVRAQAERTDALVIAEGIETIRHAREAAAAGATIGQGFLFGHPAPLPSEMPPPTEAIPLRTVPAATSATPWEVVASAREARRTTKDVLVETACSWSTRAGRGSRTLTNGALPDQLREAHEALADRAAEVDLGFALAAR
jgi:EAL domain